MKTKSTYFTAFLLMITFPYLPLEIKAQLTVINIGHYAHDISQDGQTMVLSNSRGNYIWTEAEGLVTINTISNGYSNSGRPSISADGNLVAATATNPTTQLNEMALYNRTTSTWTYLGGIEGQSDGSKSSAWGFTKDGSTAVGLGWVSAARAHAIKWTAHEGLQDLGSTVENRSSRANAISDDGEVIVGWQDAENGTRQGALWRGKNQILLSDKGTILTEASAVSADGNWVVGGNHQGPWRWTSNDQVDYVPHPDTGPFFRGAATSITADGKIVIGYFRPWPGPPIGGEGFIWTKATGRVELNAYAEALGIDTNGVQLSLPSTITSDGKYIIGSGMLNDNQVAFILNTTPLSTSEQPKNQVVLYPNPVVNSLIIKSNTPVKSVVIYTLTGQRLATPILKDNRIDVRNLEKGVYYIHLFLGNEIIQSRFIKH